MSDKRFDEDAPPEDYERMLVLKLAPSLGLVLAQQVVELIKLICGRPSP
jgi:hypothetical protein